MTDYAAPLRDMEFALRELAHLDEVLALPGFEDAGADVVASVLEEAAKIAANVIGPLNAPGDRQGSKLVDGVVKTPDGWHEAWQTLVDGTWNALPFSPEWGGMGLPHVVNTAVQEMWQSANMAFALCPMLTQGAVDAIVENGSDALKALFLPKLVSGEWTGTMNLTEPQAGSDLAAIRSRAERDGGRYRVFGQKIFITYGDHTLTENIVHLVLARLPDAPAGLKGISLFAVPKIKVDDAGTLLGPNDVRCVSLEHKLGIHGSPTAVMSFGDNGGAEGYLIGEENRGVEYMFVMMNHARLSVGVQGLGIADRAYQQAVSYARERVQGRPAGWTGGKTGIINHPDVRRMLMTMKCQVEAMRALAYEGAACIDIAHHIPDPARKAAAQQRYELLTPIIKGWSTEVGQEVASLGVQVHGGMGYVEETGAAQHLRDARITTIYEGTTAIQANDLVFRKVLRDKGAGIGALIADIRDLDADLAARPGEDFAAIRRALAEGADTLAGTVACFLGNDNPALPAAGAVPFLRLAGAVVGGYQMARAALAAARRLGEDGADAGFLNAKIATARFYAETILPTAQGFAHAATAGAAVTMAVDEAQL
ncbi:alkylation response protein AidB-like acyl-CoA dehydrogenase [Azospirillum fermentarium]|uniref:acyl-CoA dehydrogenase n=1 Tax=Azospirillum fermentarium TaxID=1233114 RepID=UPI002226FA7B|nr:acyl-CoA dehydrogenase [Azospirillum fermentarium]MCW2248820.1 alkylation response protein AidB-like acyl-CoA dehydrogenase [Azospirillum fermentarium]